MIAERIKDKKIALEVLKNIAKMIKNNEYNRIYHYCDMHNALSCISKEIVNVNSIQFTFYNNIANFKNS